MVVLVERGIEFSGGQGMGVQTGQQGACMLAVGARQRRQNARTEFVNDFETPGCINLVCNRLIFY